MKPRLSYHSIFSPTEWDRAFQNVKEGDVLKGHEVVWKHEDPDWIQVKGEDGQKRMVRRGDSFLLELVTVTPTWRIDLISQEKRT